MPSKGQNTNRVLVFYLPVVILIRVVTTHPPLVPYLLPFFTRPQPSREYIPHRVNPDPPSARGHLPIRGR
jgi:hypothetical protein